MTKRSPKELAGVRRLSAETFRRMKVTTFLHRYAWVVYASGFRVAVVKQKFPELKKAFKNFELKKLCNMKSMQPILSVFNNKRKATCVLKGAHRIKAEGFSNFKKRVEQQGPDALMELPGIGSITKKQLARDIGLADVAKDDVWLQRLVRLFSMKSHAQMTKYLSKMFNEKQGVVDIILWRFCADHGWKSYGYTSLEAFVKEKSEPSPNSPA